MRDFFLETWVKSTLRDGFIGPPGVHSYGWSWIGGCNGSHILGIQYPELRVGQPKGNMYPGTAGHWFFQTYVFVEGKRAMNLEILGHEQQLFIPMKYAPFRMSPIDTLVWDHDNNCFGIIDYKTAKDLTWVVEDAKEDNLEQVNLYAYVRKAGWYAIVYIDKTNYDHLIIHRYDTDEDMAKHSIVKLGIVEQWLNEEEFRNTHPWTYIAGGLNKWTKSRTNPYRYICEPSSRTDYGGCPFKKKCLENLSKEYGINFKSLARYDQYLEENSDDSGEFS